MRFNISLGMTPVEEFDVEALVGCIELNGAKEFFRAPTSYWGRSQYYGSWIESIEQGVARGGQSVLVTSMTDPSFANFLTVWVLYYVGDLVYVQNSMIFLDEIEGGFDLCKIDSYVGSREQFDEDGNKISEWVVPLEDVVNCLARLKTE